jgi:hypothetical protein
MMSFDLPTGSPFLFFLIVIQSTLNYSAHGGLFHIYSRGRPAAQGRSLYDLRRHEKAVPISPAFSMERRIYAGIARRLHCAGYSMFGDHDTFGQEDAG